MKKFHKNIISCFVFSLLIGLPFGFHNSYALPDSKEVTWGSSNTIKNEVTFKELNHNLEKKEEILVEEYNLPEELSYSDFKYIKASKTITYLDSITKRIISAVNINSTFRYNKTTREAICLSGFRNLANYDESYLLSVSSRCCNITTEKGAIISSIDFNKLGIGKQKIDSEDIEINCDYNGIVNFKEINV